MSCVCVSVSKHLPLSQFPSQINGMSCV